ncbi:polynucleotide adenylyltransferase PcnB [Nevskia soli]|uniref:polynucleotide adenylyltransferase PcnB n=1 Tax=Nevskia soli TaxID=418856 RepID=UPI000AD47696|nr:polynucleotide adenylyltransferase PcnB [Nevskia soli]
MTGQGGFIVKFFTRAAAWFGAQSGNEVKEDKEPIIIEPLRIPRDQHPISRSNISNGSLKVLYTLKDAGHEAYLVGGAVRDLLADIEPKDFDIATSAHPDEIRRLFRSCRLVGRRFLIAHVRMGEEILEVTTFRGPITDSHERDETGRILSDNVYGTLQEDAFRRDFTVNALYYDIRDFSIVDFAGGVEDLRQRSLRLIGDPELRYREDPVRMLRAVRIANKLGFSIAKDTAEPIHRLASLLREIPPARLFDEVLKLFLSRDAVANLKGLRKYGLFSHLLPLTDEALDADGPSVETLINRALANTAARIVADQPVTPAFLFAAMLWPAYAKRLEQLERKQGHAPPVAQVQAAEEVIAHQQLRIAIPKRFSLPMREIWSLQPRFENRRGARVKRLLSHPRFRAAYDFLLLRGQSGEPGAMELAEWWTQAQKGEDLPPLPREDHGRGPAPEQDEAPGAPGEAPKKKRRRRGGRRRRKPGEAPGGGEG